ncbi:MAG: hypothetical protein H6Q90_6700, partial [Deltaproteobacteria bacterium]|nr:hypothetical protein [Deltaproteobacteria bacterium]
LTNAVVLPGMRGIDPHQAINDGRIDKLVPQLKAVFDGFMNHMTTTVDTATGKVLADDVVVTISGDTPKTMRLAQPNNEWADASPANHLYVLGGGHLQTGWFGSIDTNDVAHGFDGTGADVPYDEVATTKLALASVAYAIAKGDERLISQFANGVTAPGIFKPTNQ